MSERSCLSIYPFLAATTRSRMPPAPSRRLVWGHVENRLLFCRLGSPDNSARIANVNICVIIMTPRLEYHTTLGVLGHSRFECDRDITYAGCFMYSTRLNRRQIMTPRVTTSRCYGTTSVTDLSFCFPFLCQFHVCFLTLLNFFTTFFQFVGTFPRFLLGYIFCPCFFSWFPSFLGSFPTRLFFDRFFVSQATLRDKSRKG